MEGFLTMRLLQICKYNLNSRGGIEAVAKTIHLTLKAKVHIVSLSFKRGKAQKSVCDEVSESVDIIVKNQPIGFKYFTYLVRNVKLFDEIVYHHPNPLALIGVLMFIRKRTKLTIFWHSDILKGWFLGTLVKPFEIIAVLRANRLIFTSRSYFDASYIKPYLNDEKVNIVPIGTTEPEQNQFHCGGISRPIKLIFVGRLEPYKGILEMLDKLSAVEQEVHLTIIGNGSLHEEVLDKIKIMREHIQIQLFADMEDAEKNVYMGSADFLILPSRSRAEAYGVVLVEALSHGTPIIVRNVAGSGMTEIASDHRGRKVGYVYEDAGKQTLSNAILEIADLTRDEYQQMRQAAKEKYEEHYKIKKFERHIVDMIST